MKKLIPFIFMFILTIFALTLVACGKTDTPKEDTPKEDTTIVDEFTGINFLSKTEVYDGNEKELTATEIPEGITVEYSDNKGTNAGEYLAKAKFSTSSGKTKTLNATLTIEKAELTGIIFAGKTVTYNGSEQKIEAVYSNLPSGVQVNYTSNKGTNAGEYIASVTFEGNNNYKTKTLNATLKIEKAILENITLTKEDVEYDTLEHSLEVVGNVPSDVTVSYYYNDVLTDQVVEVGSYNVRAVLSGTNYFTKELTAVLNITSKEEELFSIVDGQTVYFQNNLDANKLYKFFSQTLSKVNNDVASYFVKDSSSNIYYFSSSLLASSLRKLNGTATNSIYHTSGKYLTIDSNNAYYVINNLIDVNSKNGIYKLPLSGNDITPVKLCSLKAKSLAYYNGYLYFINGNDGSKIYKISTTGGNESLVYDAKCSDMIIEGSCLYFNTSTLTNKAIYKYNITSTNSTKLTNDAGKYLTIIGSKLYYINCDLLTSNLFGKGIYCTDISGSSLVGTKVIETNDNGYSSLSSDGNYLYFYKLNDKHFYSYNISSKTEKDLMANFVVQDTSKPIGYSEIKEYNGEIYYISMVEDGALYKYNSSKKKAYKLITDSVSNFYIHDGYLYYSTYVLTNYALFKMNLQDNTTQKISSNRCDNLIFDDDYIYFVKVGSAYNDNIYKMKNDGT